MRWYHQSSRPIIKEAIAVRRDGLLGLGDIGWLDHPIDRDINDAIQYVKEAYDIDIDDYFLIDMGYVPVDQLPGDSFGWLESERGSIGLNDIKYRNRDELIKILDAQVSGRSYTETINLLLQKRLSPVIAFEDYGVADGRGRANLANALDIPVRLYILSRARAQ